MIQTLLILFTIAPICEWGIHYLLHTGEIRIHLRHHEKVNKKTNSIEIWPLGVLFLCYYFNSLLVALGVLKYYIIHTLIHFKPDLVPNLANHHITHHTYKKYNYCVCNIWPDKLFGTYRESQLKKC